MRLAGGGAATAADFCRMNFLLGELFCAAGETLCAQSGIRPADVDLIGSHGQTFWHIPEPEEYLSHTLTGTLQLGEEAALAERFGCTAVPLPFPPAPYQPRENRLIRHVGPLLTGLFAVLLLIFWGIWQHRLNREYTGSPQVPAVSAVHPASDSPRTGDARSAVSLSPQPSTIIQKGREAVGSKKQPIPDVYGELRNRLAGRTPAPASHDPGHPGANNRNTTPGRAS